MYTIDYSSLKVKGSDSYDYWRRRLDAGSLYNMTLKDVLVDAFDYPLVHSKDIQYNFDQDELVKMFNVINKFSFSSALSNIYLTCGPMSNIVLAIQRNLLDAESFMTKVDVKSCRRMFSCNVSTGGIYDYVIAVNQDAYQKVMFIDVVRDVVHMMMHCYCMIGMQNFTNSDVSLHTTSFNEHEKHIISQLDDVEYDALSFNVSYSVSQLVDNTAESVVDYSDVNNIVVKNRHSMQSTLIHFD